MLILLGQRLHSRLNNHTNKTLLSDARLETSGDVKTVQSAKENAVHADKKIVNGP